MKYASTKKWMGRARAAAVMLAASCWLGGVAEATVIFSHTGTNDPNAAPENWEIVQAGSGSSITTGPSSDGLAWQILSTADIGNSATWQSQYYKQEIDPQNWAGYRSVGWSLNASMQIPGAEAQANMGQVGLAAWVPQDTGFSGKLWSLGFARDAAGTVTLSLDQSPSAPATYVVPGGGGYHTYTIVQEPGTANDEMIDIYVDGILAIDDSPGRTLATNNSRVQFGDNAQEAAGESWWNSVEFASPGVIPSPPSGVTDFTWQNSVGGNWTNSQNWNAGGPPGLPGQNANHTVTFGSVISNNSTVFTDTDVSVRNVTFENSATYNVSGTGTLSLVQGTAAGSPDTGIFVAFGSHQFQLNVNLLNDTTVDINSGSTLEFNNRLFLNGNTLTKTGGGTISINNDIITAGGTVDIQQGTVMGVGTIGGDVNNGGGTISPGNPGAQGTSIVPEPATWLLLGLGLLVWRATVRNRQQ